MGLDVWFNDDVARILASTWETMAATAHAVPALDPDRASEYRQGFGDALRAVAIAFGVRPPPGGDHDRNQVRIIDSQPS